MAGRADLDLYNVLRGFGWARERVELVKATLDPSFLVRARHALLPLQEVADFSLAWRLEDYLDIQWGKVPRYVAAALKGFTGLAKGAAIERTFDERFGPMTSSSTAAAGPSSSDPVTSGPAQPSTRCGRGPARAPGSRDMAARLVNCDSGGHDGSLAGIGESRSLSRAALAFRAGHAVIAVGFLAAIADVWASALTGRRGPLLHASVAALVAEGVVVAANGGTCPLGGLQDRMGDPVPLFELVLPPRAARLAVPVLGAVTAAGIVELARRPASVGDDLEGQAAAWSAAAPVIAATTASRGVPSSERASVHRRSGPRLSTVAPTLRRR